MPKSNPILCTSIAASIGGMGVLLHNRAYQDAKINAVYVSFEPSGAKEAVCAMRALGIRGMGVTMPYKVEVMDYVDQLDAAAQEIGAVNTIVNDNGILTGYNTDWVGAITGLLSAGSLRAKSAALFGAGGAARAILYGLLREGSSVCCYNNNPDRGEALCSDFQIPYGGAIKDYRKEGYDIIVNATPVGFRTSETLLTADQFPSGALVLDAVFRPLDTTFAKEAAKAGCTVVHGYEMLIHQAIAQDELYLGITPSYQVMKDVLYQILGE